MPYHVWWKQCPVDLVGQDVHHTILVYTLLYQLICILNRKHKLQQATEVLALTSMQYLWTSCMSKAMGSM
ncbi:hypothetical protein DPMN_087344 [Dreissena polymorpha]|uniref:Uncharacterized protein n=1 Tax=Dreissena polymorpha TaxID=45954 RepID=A0A9D4KT14_DREPO|nr:hypothetical protein DPMN_087344 [Dreissena polymorpha]